MKASRVTARSLILVVLLMTALLAACTATPAPAPAPKPAPAPAPAAPAPAAKPAPAPAPAPAPKPAPVAKPAPAPAPKPAAAKPTGTLRVALTTFYTERFGVEEGTGSSIPAGVYEWLVNTDLNGKTIPMLAERWEQSPDAKVWTFYLRKGVQFHDGWGEMTAEDVKFSVEQGGKKGSLNTLYTQWAKQLESIEVVNPYQVTFRFKQPYITALFEAGPTNPKAMVGSKKYYAAKGAEEANRRPIGTGPYKFVEHILGDTVRVQAVTDHWRKTPGFEYIVYKLVPEEASTIQMLKAGDIDIANIPVTAIDELKARKFSTTRSQKAFALNVGLGGLFPKAAYPKEFDPKIPWVGDPNDPASLAKAYKVRYALALGIDKESIIRNIYRGAGSLHALPYYDAGDPWTDPSWKPIPYDPVKAKQLLAEAGYPNGLEFTLWTYSQVGQSELPKVGEAVAMQWQQIGVKANLRLSDSGIFKPGYLAKRNLGYAAFLSGGPARYEDEPLTAYTIFYYSKGRYYQGVEDPRLDALQDKILGEPDPVKRAALQKQRGQLMYDNTWILPIGYGDLVFATSPKVAQWPKPPGKYLTNLEDAVPAK